MELIIWVFGGLLLFASSMLGILYRQQQKRFGTIEKSVKLILERTDFVTFIAMDKTREQHWDSWRETLEKRIDKHDERLGDVEGEVARLGGRINGQR